MTTRTFIYVFLIIGIVALFMINLDQKTLRERQDTVIADLQLKNKSLEEEIKVYNHIIITSRGKLKASRDSVAILKANFEKLQVGYSHLKFAYEDLKKAIKETPPDESYKFLMVTAYPYPGNLEYPFNALQVNAMHLTYMERNIFKEMNLNLEGQVDNCQKRVENYEGQVDLLEGMIAQQDHKYSACREIISNKDKEIAIREDQHGRCKKNGWIWKGATVIVTIIAILT
jgi:hypothetical protein